MKSTLKIIKTLRGIGIITKSEIINIPIMTMSIGLVHINEQNKRD